ncbi:hypothetical protein BDZ85DRAFT_256958 [Elsinoe ampelina]|uniref:Uncharacterized protein n=1 Tax=Elsinoe ampelina TaxID=302913 RepID=A0A6A6GMK0_9PEZI|nr:hypothetical protein BDZ85DRAFT_256958 [Elsinoe ampelina]
MVVLNTRLLRGTSVPGLGSSAIVGATRVHGVVIELRSGYRLDCGWQMATFLNRTGPDRIFGLQEVHVVLCSQPIIKLVPAMTTTRDQEVW